MHLSGLTVREAALRTWNRINEHAVLSRAAAISFYAIAALIPFMGLVIALTAQWLPRITRAAGGGSIDESLDLLRYLVADDAVSLIGRELNRLREQPPTELISVGVIALLWLSSSVFVEVIDAMNVIVGARESRPFWKRRLIAVAMTVSQAAILIAATATIAAWPQIMKVFGLGPTASLLATAVHGLMVFIMVLFSIAVTLHMAPDAEQDWVWITPGSVLGSFVVVGVSLLFRIYVQNWGNYGATYGSLAGIIVLTTWIWLCSVQLLVAAELNKVIEDASRLGECLGQRPEAEKYAAVG
jgi:membrane protein